jgi:hypothetical protein
LSTVSKSARLSLRTIRRSNALSKSSRLSDAPTFSAISTKRLWRSASVNFGFDPGDNLFVMKPILTRRELADDDECPLVLIEWEDSTQPYGRWQWLSSVALPKVVLCVSVGYLIRDTHQAKTLAPNLGNVDCEDDVQASGLISIPARSIRRIVRIDEINDPSASCTTKNVVGSKGRPVSEIRQKRPTRESLPRSIRRGA